MQAEIISSTLDLAFLHGPPPMKIGVVAFFDAFDGAQLMREIILLRSPATAPEKRLMARS
jgi:hypothetical protein